ncbi:hypothetical protein FOTG_16505 [Fusarium oxysporum f. sp. vasinfectum 25433]|uniref:Uncharacterized protein n=1 Tax=Fusarium oxysporum f. sp. vasinfectum 25433 TaxID=1089449 RepID=X0KNF3_FUSOX|nr:hypothetical protein FOTG_16505 [Fusarium oxysporum f. sp. vasinfectum 25433]
MITNIGASSPCLVAIAYVVDHLGPAAIIPNDQHEPLGPVPDFTHYLLIPNPSPDG